MELTPELYRRAMGSFATGVAIVAYQRQDGKLGGLTVNSLSSLSLDPLLLLVCVSKGTASHDELLSAENFSVNILRAGQENISAHFASKHVRADERFVNTDWFPAKSGTPLIAGSIAHIVCDLYEKYPGGDHTIFLGKVNEIQVHAGDPLVFFRGKYRQLS